MHQRLWIEIGYQQDTDTIFARFSEEEGLLPATDTIGEPLRLIVRYQRDKRLAAVQPKDKKAEPIWEEVVLSRTLIVKKGNTIILCE